MTYIISDLHGHMNEFLQMLEKINFSDNDILYVLGDVIDRGPLPVTLLIYILSKSNIILLMGNHEKMMLDSFRDESSWGLHTKSIWNNNGSSSTLKEFNKLTSEEQDTLLDKIEKLPYYDIVECNNQTYLLSHSGVAMRDGDTLEEAIEADVSTRRILWNREDILFWKNRSDTIMIHGHTPTIRWHPDYKPLIYHYEDGKKINVDCGCTLNLKMGCLCLDTMEEYYVDCESIMKKIF